MLAFIKRVLLYVARWFAGKIAWYIIMPMANRISWLWRTLFDFTWPKGRPADGHIEF